MASHLQQLLQSLCWNTEWNYAVFWKLKHHARMVLTWEDAFYNDLFKLDPSKSNGFGEALESFHDGHVAHDPVGLAVAKMSYRVYSLGEGIVGQVAVTGKHRWIFAGEQAMNPCSSLELCDGWQAQFAAGIKAVVVAAVVPHGVVQLGSLNKVNENLQLLNHIRCLFSSLQDSACHIQTPIQSNLQNVLQMSDLPVRNFVPDLLQECVLDRATNNENIFSSPLELQSPKRHLVDSFGSSLPGVHLSEAVELMRKNGLIQSISENHESSDLVNDANCGSNIYKIQNGVTVAGRQICTSSQSCLTENSAPYDVKLSAEKPRVQLDGGNHISDKKVQTMAAPGSLDKQKAEENTSNQSELSCLDALGNLQSPSMFSAGTELHEALGPAFSKQCYPWSWDSENPEERLASQMPEAMESSLLTTDSGTDHLLEAVVANFCRKDAIFKSAKSLSTSESMLTTEKMPEPSINTSHTIGSSSYYSIGCSSLIEESTQNCLNSSESCSIKSSTSSYRDQLVKPTEPGKPNKKRARPGESSRPRPRDRQLIQDRIKELRELVPNGSKCSIDSLLERTIKHMIFMQSVNKHADKLSNFVKSKGSSEMGVQGASYEQGSSWAVEVGGHMKICPIVVENLNMNGQMLIEMLCEDSDHFLEITEAVRSLGLTILKGMTDNHGDKTWMRFVVESQSNRNLHRMDVLWSLVQLLQSKSTV